MPDSQNRIWVGTSAGLNLLDPLTGKCRRYTERDGLPNNTIYAVQEDESGRMWMSTNYGLSRLDPETGVFRNYTAREGVQDNEFNMGATHGPQRPDVFRGDQRVQLLPGRQHQPQPLRAGQSPSPTFASSTSPFARW